MEAEDVGGETQLDEGEVIVQAGLPIQDEVNNGEDIEKPAEEGVEKALKDTKRELTKLYDERAEMREKMAKLEGVVETLSKSGEKAVDPPVNPFAFLDSEEFKEEFFSTPDKPIGAFKNIVEVFGNALLARDERIAAQERKLEEMREDMRSSSSRPNPEIAEAMAELKKDSDFAGFTDKQLFVLAKKSLDSNGKKPFLGNPSSGRRAQQGGGSGDPQFDKAVKEMMRKIGYEGE